MLPGMHIPSNVELRPPPTDNARLYDEGDVCVQPSHWEGLGLQLLECQAAGLPLVTTDAPPMNEFAPLRTVPSREKELLRGMADHVLTAHKLSAEALAATLEPLYKADIRESSAEARAFIEREHSWNVVLPIFQRALCR
jgi:glycosyltransferase involved in cell wall biosynthesis